MAVCGLAAGMELSNAGFEETATADKIPSWRWLTVPADGTVKVELVGEAHSGTRCVRVTHEGEDAWYLECAISFDSFGHFGVPGTVWGFNVNRDRAAGGDTEWSGWSDTMGGFHAPERFGQLVFGGEAGGVDRAMIIECARYAKESIRLERAVRDGLRLISESGLEALDPKDRGEVQPALDAAEKSLEQLRALLAQSTALDLEDWRRVTGGLREEADDIGEITWVIKFAVLLADD